MASMTVGSVTGCASTAQSSSGRPRHLRVRGPDTAGRRRTNVAVDKRRLSVTTRGERMHRLTALGLIAALLACQSGPGALTISEPTGGSVINADTVMVRGTAPADTEVIQDVDAGFDNRTFSDASGQWRMEVPLEVGDNVLTFRLDDDPDHASEKQVLVIRER